jgi:pyridoxamine 5'-phosphate oxidase
VGSPVSISLADLRREYTQAGLDARDLDPDPLKQFAKWFEQALKAGIREPNAMVLATVGPGAQPSVRIVLLKGVDQRGFTFFTSYQSRKAAELEHNSKAALNFPWIELERQVNVAGRVTKLSRAESEAYFKVRPRGSRLGALASHQSSVLRDRSVLEQRMRELEAQFPGDEIPMPDYWGGYCLAPTEIEFWQGRPNRLHDRFRYARTENAPWTVNRLAP